MRRGLQSSEYGQGGTQGGLGAKIPLEFDMLQKLYYLNKGD